MRYRDAFSGYHPAVNLLYFSLVLVFPVFLMHPAVLGASLAGAAVYAVSLNGPRAAWASLRYLLPMALLAAVINPAFNHEGATVLAYLPTGNPLTLESVLFGAAAAAMLAAVAVWFSCYTAVMTSDKFIYLFGRIIPAMSLILSMALRFVPRFQAQFRQVRQARRGAGLDADGGGILRRAGRGAAVLSVMVTWSLESAIQTADSMRSRGYGLPGRTAFSIYRFDGRDRAAMGWLIFCGAFLFAGWMAGGFAWRYFPTVRGGPPSPLTASFPLVYLALCLTPVAINGWERRKWRRLQSKI